jgi:hypothetical protein
MSKTVDGIPHVIKVYQTGATYSVGLARRLADNTTSLDRCFPVHQKQESEFSVISLAEGCPVSEMFTTLEDAVRYSIRVSGIHHKGLRQEDLPIVYDIYHRVTTHDPSGTK